MQALKHAGPCSGPLGLQRYRYPTAQKLPYRLGLDGFRARHKHIRVQFLFGGGVTNGNDIHFVSRYAQTSFDRH